MERLSWIVVSVAANAAWQAPIVAAAALLGCRLMRGRPRVQHLVWQCALVMAVVLPLVTVASIPIARSFTAAAQSVTTPYVWRWMPQIDSTIAGSIAIAFLLTCGGRLALLAARVRAVRQTLLGARPASDPRLERVRRTCSQAFRLHPI